MSWFFYNKEGKLLYDVVSGSLGDAATLQGVAASGFVRIGAPGLNSGNVDIDGSVTLPLHNIVVDTLLDATYRTVLVNSAAAPRLITLPAAPLTGQIYDIRDQGNTGVGDSATNNITIGRNGNSIDGVAADLVLSQNGIGVILAYNGFQWITLADRTVSAGGAINADTLDGLDSTSFLRSDAPDTATNSITFNEVTQFDKSTYGPVDILDDTTNPNLLDNTHRTIVADPVINSLPVTITLPAAPVVGQWYEIMDSKGGSATNNVTIDPNGNFIDTSGANLILDTNFDSIILVCTDAANWAIVAWRYPPSGSGPALDDLSDVTITAPADGELFRFSTAAGSEWVNTPLATLDDSGRLFLLNDNIAGGISLGDVGAGNEVTMLWVADNTVALVGRTVHSGTRNDGIFILENGVVPAADTYDIAPPFDNTLLCNTSAGDLFIRMTNALSAAAIGGIPVADGDIITIKDAEGSAAINILALVAEGVRRRNVPVLALDTPTGTIADATTTTIPGGIGVDEIQDFKVTGSGTYNIDFDGAITAGLTELSTALQVEAAINALSPHANYGYFAVSVTGVDALGGLAVTFDGGALIDGEADFYAANPYQSMKAIYNSGNWFLL